MSHYLAPISKPILPGCRGNQGGKGGETLQTRSAEQRQNSQKKVWKKLTDSEMADRRANGLCFNCDDLFAPGHMCKPILFYILPVLDSEDQ